MANLSKDKDAKLQGLTFKDYASQLPVILKKTNRYPFSLF